MAIPTLFLDVDTLTETFPLRMDLKELVPSLGTKKRYNCIYTPGYIDELGELEFLQNLQYKHLKYITCGMQFILGPQQYISVL